MYAKKYSLETAFSKVYNEYDLIKPVVETYDFLGRNMSCGNIAKDV